MPHMALASSMMALRMPPFRAASFPATAVLFQTVAASISSTVPSLSSLLADIWESVLRAVPKKKTSHSKSRHRQMAGKALKDVTFVSTCSGCGRIKRSHVLCPYCVQCKDIMIQADEGVC